MVEIPDERLGSFRTADDDQVIVLTLEAAEAFRRNFTAIWTQGLRAT